jgi:hypothetical protein
MLYVNKKPLRVSNKTISLPWFLLLLCIPFLNFRDLLVFFPDFPSYLRRLLHHLVPSFRDVR